MSVNTMEMNPIFCYFFSSSVCHLLLSMNLTTKQCQQLVVNKSNVSRFVSYFYWLKCHLHSGNYFTSNRKFSEEVTEEQDEKSITFPLTCATSTFYLLSFFSFFFVFVHRISRQEIDKLDRRSNTFFNNEEKEEENCTMGADTMVNSKWQRGTCSENEIVNDVWLTDWTTYMYKQRYQQQNLLTQKWEWMATTTGEKKEEQKEIQKLIT